VQANHDLMAAELAQQVREHTEQLAQAERERMQYQEQQASMQHQLQENEALADALRIEAQVFEQTQQSLTAQLATKDARIGEQATQLEAFTNRVAGLEATQQELEQVVQLLRTEART
jgi:chromosome segregation ATPase